MSKALLRNAIVGGLIVFVWGILSWMVIPWHQSCFMKFTNESEVAEVIQDNAPVDGMYILPNTLHYNEKTSKKEISRGMQMMQKGPFVFASVRLGGMGKMSAKPFVISLITQIVGAFIVCWLLSQAKGMKFRKQVCFVTVFGLGVAILSQVPHWNWWGFSCCYVWVMMLDLIIGWFLAGLAIARLNRAK